MDRPFLRQAVIALQEHERQIHDTRLPGEHIADAYLDWILQQTDAEGGILIADVAGSAVGFAAGWVEQEHALAETVASNRFGYISDVYVLPLYRGRGIAKALLDALTDHLGSAGVTRVRIGSLAANRLARTAYERAGFSPYEVIYEKVIANKIGA